MELSQQERALATAIQGGLPFVSRPFAAIGAGIGMRESEVLEHLNRMIVNGVIKRFGIVARHHELGYKANGMVVWNIPDRRVDALGRCFADVDFITLCYRRPRRLPDWPYNLFCMIHGRSRDTVMQQIQELISRFNLENVPYEVLFSLRRFKQRGAFYTQPGVGLQADGATFFLDMTPAIQGAIPG